MAKSKKTIIPPSLQPRKNTKKAIPGGVKKESIAKPKVKKPAIIKAEVVSLSTPLVVKQAPVEPTPTPKTEKKRFTLWLENNTYRAFKVHVAMSGGSASEYIESLIKRDLNL